MYSSELNRAGDFITKPPLDSMYIPRLHHAEHSRGANIPVAYQSVM